MSKPYQLVVFDWEGTISDTLGPILHIVATEAKNLGYDTLDPVKARKYVDLGLVSALRKLFPDLTSKQNEHFVQLVQAALVSRPTEVYLIPGAMEFIKQLYEDKVSIAVATNKGHHSLMRALESSGLNKYIRVTRSAGQVPAKPCPQMLEEILQLMGGSPETTLMIGDSTTDMEMAQSISVDAIGVDFYHQQTEALKAAGALAVFDDYKLLAEYINLPKK
ncbi:MAG: HAD-IA family hydrolase [Legionella sp.]|jgi:phosphoglycolate phosphatase